MIEHLAVLVDAFPGAPNQTRCFAHILNLVVKSVLRQFEAPKKGKELADVVDHVVMEIDNDNNDKDEGDGSDNEGGSNECEDVDDEVVDDDEDGLLPDEMSEEESLRVKERVKPIRLVLTKVS